MSGGFYLYGIVRADADVALGNGASGEPLRSIESGGPLGLAAVAGESEGPPPRPEPAALSAHDAVVRRLAERFPALLPARFGQWLPDEQTVIRQLAAHGPELAEALAKVEGCVQMTLRVYLREMAEPVELAPPETPGGGPGTRYMEQLRREAERARTLPEIAPLRDALRPLLRGERIERPAAPGRLRATAYDLIARDAAGAYSRIVAETAPLLGSCWRVTASGPWPPYAFTPRPAA